MSKIVRVGAEAGALFCGDTRTREIPRLPDGVSMDLYESIQRPYSYPLTLLPVLDIIEYYSDQPDHESVVLYGEVSGKKGHYHFRPLTLHVNGNLLSDQECLTVFKRFGLK